MSDLTAVADDRTSLTTRLDQLNDELADIDERRAAIKGQIEKAQADHHATGEFADPDWFRRAKGALRHLGVERAEVCREIGETNRRLRALRGAQGRDLFRAAVQETVDTATWERIVARHGRLLTDAGL